MMENIKSKILSEITKACQNQEWERTRSLMQFPFVSDFCILNSIPKPNHPNKRGQFDNKEFLGSGQFGNVFLTELKIRKNTQKIDKKQIAMKVISKTDGQNYKNEFAIHTALKHPNIIRCHYIFENQIRSFMIMEYAKGHDLWEKLQNKTKFEEKEAAVIIEQIGAALQYIHSLGIVHRDIKAENVLFDSDGIAKLIDFGFSTWNLSGKLYDPVGTIFYVCPEIVNHQYYSYKVDVWALCVLAYEIVVGYTPFTSHNILEIKDNISKVRYSIPAWVSQEMRTMVQKVLVLDKKKRSNLDTFLSSKWFK